MHSRRRNAKVLVVAMVTAHTHTRHRVRLSQSYINTHTRERVYRRRECVYFLLSFFSFFFSLLFAQPYQSRDILYPISTYFLFFPSSRWRRWPVTSDARAAAGIPKDRRRRRAKLVIADTPRDRRPRSSDIHHAPCMTRCNTQYTLHFSPRSVQRSPNQTGRGETYAFSYDVL